jgi:hypothetical protein
VGTAHLPPYGSELGPLFGVFGFVNVSYSFAKIVVGVCSAVDSFYSE